MAPALSATTALTPGRVVLRLTLPADAPVRIRLVREISGWPASAVDGWPRGDGTVADGGIDPRLIDVELPDPDLQPLAGPSEGAGWTLHGTYVTDGEGDAGAWHIAVDDTGLPAGEHLYYQLFVADGDGWQPRMSARADAFALGGAGMAQRAYDLLPAVHRRHDRPVGDQPGQLRRFFDVVSPPLDLARSHADALIGRNDVSRAPLTAVEHLARLLGWPDDASAPVAARRNGVRHATGHFDRIGTLGGLQTTIARLTGGEGAVRIQPLARNVFRLNAPERVGESELWTGRLVEVAGERPTIVDSAPFETLADALGYDGAPAAVAIAGPRPGMLCARHARSAALGAPRTLVLSWSEYEGGAWSERRRRLYAPPSDPAAGPVASGASAPCLVRLPGDGPPRVQVLWTVGHGVHAAIWGCIVEIRETPDVNRDRYVFEVAPPIRLLDRGGEGAGQPSAAIVDGRLWLCFGGRSGGHGYVWITHADVTQSSSPHGWSRPRRLARTPGHHHEPVIVARPDGSTADALWVHADPAADATERVSLMASSLTRGPTGPEGPEPVVLHSVPGDSRDVIGGLTAAWAVDGQHMMLAWHQGDRRADPGTLSGARRLWCHTFTLDGDDLAAEGSATSLSTGSDDAEPYLLPVGGEPSATHLVWRSNRRWLGRLSGTVDFSDDVLLAELRNKRFSDRVHVTPYFGPDAPDEIVPVRPTALGLYHGGFGEDAAAVGDRVIAGLTPFMPVHLRPIWLDDQGTVEGGGGGVDEPEGVEGHVEALGAELVVGEGWMAAPRRARQSQRPPWRVVDDTFADALGVEVDVLDHRGDIRHVVPRPKPPIVDHFAEALGAEVAMTEWLDTRHRPGPNHPPPAPHVDRFAEAIGADVRIADLGGG